MSSDIKLLPIELHGSLGGSPGEVELPVSVQRHVERRPLGIERDGARHVGVRKEPGVRRLLVAAEDRRVLEVGMQHAIRCAGGRGERSSQDDPGEGGESDVSIRSMKRAHVLLR